MVLSAASPTSWYLKQDVDIGRERREDVRLVTDERWPGLLAPALSGL